MALTAEQVFTVYANKYNSLVHVAVSITGSTLLAEDVVQDVAVKLIELQPALENEHHCSRYLYNAVKNRSLNAQRKQRHVVPDGEDALGILADEASERERADAETTQWLRDVLDSFDLAVKEAFIRHVLLRERISDLAKEMDMLPNTLQGKFAKVRAHLKRHYLLFVDLLLMLKLTLTLWFR